MREHPGIMVKLFKSVEKPTFFLSDLTEPFRGLCSSRNRLAMIYFKYLITQYHQAMFIAE